jgi:hypothetical protein
MNSLKPMTRVKNVYAQVFNVMNGAKSAPIGFTYPGQSGLPGSCYPDVNQKGQREKRF